MRGTARRAAAWTTLVIGVLAQVLPSAPPAAAAGVAAPINYELIAMINHERFAHGMPTLPPADLGAQAWAQHLIATGSLSHASLTVDAENLASASSNHTTGDMIHMWLTSPGHATNLLNPSAVLVDVGIACAGGRMVAVARFRQAWASPTVSAAPRVIPPGSGHSCAMLGMG